MQAKKKRLTLDMDPLLQRRLKVIAALNGTSMRRYCIDVIERELARDEAGDAKTMLFGKEAIDRLFLLQTEVFKGRKVTGDSTDFIREARDARAKAQ